MKTATVLLLLQAVVVCALVPAVAHATPVAGQSALELEAQKIKFPIASSSTADCGYLLAVTTADSTSNFAQPGTQQKSPVKAFLLSAAVPGLGQYYYGSRIKPFVFLGVEVVAWGLYFKWHGDGEDLTDAFEAFHHLHWSRDDYENKYLAWAYGATDDDSISESEVSHHLPDEETQQYFEMTGKYDQFAWGWDDAVFNGNTLDDYNGSGNPPPRIIGDNTVPYSARRLYYEEQRDRANRSFDKATRMIMVSVANRLVSAMEAFLMTKHRNETGGRMAQKGGGGILAQIKVDARMKSYHERNDTPYVKFTYIF